MVNINQYKHYGHWQRDEPCKPCSCVRTVPGDHPDLDSKNTSCKVSPPTTHLILIRLPCLKSSIKLVISQDNSIKVPWHRWPGLGQVAPQFRFLNIVSLWIGLKGGRGQSSLVLGIKMMIFSSPTVRQTLDSRWQLAITWNLDTFCPSSSSPCTSSSSCPSSSPCP